MVSPSSWQHLVQDASPKQARQKHKANHQQTEFLQTFQNIPPHTALPLRGKKENTSSHWNTVKSHPQKEINTNHFVVGKDQNRNQKKEGIDQP